MGASNIGSQLFLPIFGNFHPASPYKLKVKYYLIFFGGNPSTIYVYMFSLVLFVILKFVTCVSVNLDVFLYLFKLIT